MGAVLIKAFTMERGTACIESPKTQIPITFSKSR